jgi:hypothetical protein
MHLELYQEDVVCDGLDSFVVVKMPWDSPTGSFIATAQFIQDLDQSMLNSSVS